MAFQRNDDYLVITRDSEDKSYKVKFEKVVQEASIDDLKDVDTSGLSNGDVLTWNSTASEWEAKNIPPQDTLFLGTRDCTTQGPEGTEKDGEFWLNTGSGVLLGSWGINAPDNQVFGGELLIGDGAGNFINGGSVGGTPTVLSVDVQNGVKHVAGTNSTGAVQLEIDETYLDNLYAREDHSHPDASIVDSGFMSAADKLKLSNATSAGTPDTLVMRDGTGATTLSALQTAYYDLSLLTELS